MRPAIVQFLENHGLAWLAWFVPAPGLVYTIVFVAVVLLFLRRSKAVGLPEDRTLEVTLAAAFTGVIGTRLYYLFISEGLFRLSPVEWLDLSKGTGSWGAYVGAILGVVLYTQLLGLSSWRYLDTAASCAGLGPLIGRWSCFLAGDDFGKITAVPWGVTFPPNSFPFREHVAAGLIPPDAQASFPVHPFQLYLVLNGLLIFLVLSSIWRSSHQHYGRTFGAFLFLYGATRFSWEFLRGPSVGMVGVLSSSQAMCLGLIAAGTIVLFWTRKAPELASAPEAA